MTNHTATPLATTDGQKFVVYTGNEGTVFIERIRPSGRRDSGSIFQFDAAVLAAALAAVMAPAARLAIVAAAA